MLTTFEVLLYGLVILLLPLVVHSLTTGSKPPEKSWFARYYRIEKHLNLAGNLFLLALCANAVARLGLHFGYIDAGAQDRVALAVGIPFAVTLLAFLGLWIRAALKLRRLDKNTT